LGAPGCAWYRRDHGAGGIINVEVKHGCAVDKNTLGFVLAMGVLDWTKTMLEVGNLVNRLKFQAKSGSVCTSKTVAFCKSNACVLQVERVRAVFIPCR
jgi:hypothetical protein